MPPKRARMSDDESAGKGKKLKTEPKPTKTKKALPKQSAKVVKKKPVAKKPAEKKPAAKKPAEKQLAAKKPAEKQLAAKKPAEKQPAAKKPGTKVTKAAAADLCLIDLITDPVWKSKLEICLQEDVFKKMQAWLHEQYEGTQVFPPKHLIFNAFNSTPFNGVKVVILGQDPYHDDGQAHGLSFSVPPGIGIPPSLKNIYKELVNDIPGFMAPSHGNLQDWTQQGVLLLNAALTVKAHEPNSHARCGWWKFTDAVIRLISDEAQPCVFLLWGGFAHKKESLIDNKKHRVVKTAHPSPLSFNKFKNCKCFSLVNAGLNELGRDPVDWTIQP